MQKLEPKSTDWSNPNQCLYFTKFDRIVFIIFFFISKNFVLIFVP